MKKPHGLLPLLKCITPATQSHTRNPLFSPYTNSAVATMTSAELEAVATMTSAESKAVATVAANDDDDDVLGLSPLIIRHGDLLRKSKNPSSLSGLHILDLVDAGSLEPDYNLYSDLVKSCTQSKSLTEARAVYAHFRNSHFKGEIFFHNSLVNMFAKCGAMGDAHEVFDAMRERDVVTWTALITGYAQSGFPEMAVELLPLMLENEMEPNEFTFASLLNAVGTCKLNEIGRQIHGLVIKSWLHLNVYVCTSLLDMYARCGKMEEAQLVFDGLKSKNEVSWNALIAGYERNGRVQISLKKFWEMQRANVTATHYSYSSAFGACASIGALEQGRWVHAHMMKTGHKMTSFVGNTLLDMYAKAGSIVDARKVFEHQDKRDIVSWNSMLKGLSQHGLGKEAIQHFNDMLKYGISPNEISFLCVLAACSHNGLLNEGRQHFKLMKKYQVEPEVEHYVTMVDLFGRAGLLRQAEDFIKQMPIQPTAAIWGALLGACRMHKNAELGKYAAQRIFELNTSDAGPRMILSNIYSSVGRWSEAAEVRRTMRDAGVKKDPAYSWVEVGNSIHRFVANDDSHPQNKEIYKMWEKINVKIKEAGYIPDTSYALLCMDEREREASLQYHSEKLALSFSLLSAPPGAIIHVKKNIRMCGDCHSAFKFVSHIFEREVIVRDTKRFHHFKFGSCSCGDYW